MVCRFAERGVNPWERVALPDGSVGLQLLLNSADIRIWIIWLIQREILTVRWPVKGMQERCHLRSVMPVSFWRRIQSIPSITRQDPSSSLRIVSILRHVSSAEPGIVKKSSPHHAKCLPSDPLFKDIHILCLVSRHDMLSSATHVLGISCAIGLAKTWTWKITVTTGNESRSGAATGKNQTDTSSPPLHTVYRQDTTVQSARTASVHMHIFKDEMSQRNPGSASATRIWPTTLSACVLSRCTRPLHQLLG